jgi:ABC-2 type transport system ATP-binding protein
MEQPIVVAEGLSRHFRVSEKQPGIAGTLRHLLQRRYRSVEAVSDLTMAIQPGEMVGFLGPNGAGKTTTLKMLSGLIHPSGGRVLVAGCTPFRRQERFLRQITLVMGNRQQLIWDLPPMETFRVNAAVYGIDDGEARRRIDQLAEMLELGEELHRPVRKLSLGERMKAELLAALLHRPAVLFLDEPTLGLDVNAQVRVREFLADYNRRFGATVLLTSHYMGDITALCDRVLLIHQGRLFHDGSLEALTSRLSPCREVRLELRQCAPVGEFAAYGSVEEHSGQLVRLRIPRAELTQRVAALLGRFEVLDLEVRDPPIEELIGALFREPAGARDLAVDRPGGGASAETAATAADREADGPAPDPRPC